MFRASFVFPLGSRDLLGSKDGQTYLKLADQDGWVFGKLDARRNGATDCPAMMAEASWLVESEFLLLKNEN